jgi:hypothetical protein
MILGMCVRDWTLVSASHGEASEHLWLANRGRTGEVPTAVTLSPQDLRALWGIGSEAPSADGVVDATGTPHDRPAVHDRCVRAPRSLVLRMPMGLTSTPRRVGLRAMGDGEARVPDAVNVPVAWQPQDGVRAGERDESVPTPLVLTQREQA